MTIPPINTLICPILILLAAPPAPGQGRGRGGGGMPAEFQDLIHQLFAHPEKIVRKVDLREKGYLAETTTSDPALVAALQKHVEQMSGRLGGGRPVRRWDPAFEEFFSHYDDMEHKFTKLKRGVRAEVTGKTPEAIAAAHNHARVILDFSSQGHAQAHQPHRTALDDDGGEAGRFRGGPPHAREAELADSFGARAERAAGDLMTTLGGQLKAAIKTGGPEAAVPVCSEVAVALTRSVGDKFEGLTIKRVTGRPRNPDNRADALDREAMKRFRAEGEARPIAHLTTARDGRTVRYYKPLAVGEVCLKCHGDRGATSKDLRALLEARYPEDRAHGYKLGELRGLIRVERAE